MNRAMPQPSDIALALLVAPPRDVATENPNSDSNFRAFRFQLAETAHHHAQANRTPGGR